MSALQKRISTFEGKKMKNMNKIGGKGKLIFYICVAALPMLQFILLWFCVNVNSIFLAFQEYDATNGVYEWLKVDRFFQNFKDVFRDFKEMPFFASSLKNTLIMYFSSIIIGTPLGLMFSYYIYKKRFGHSVYKVILFLPSILSSIIIVTIYKYFVDRAIPEISEMANGTEMAGLLANPETTLITVIFYNIWMGFGTSTLMYSSTMSSIPESVVEAAKIDGVTPFKEFIHITIPLIWNTFATFVVTGFAGLFTNQANLYTFFDSSAPYRLYTFGYYLYVQVRTAPIKDYPYLSAVGLVLTLVALPLTLLVRKMMDKIGPSAS